MLPKSFDAPVDKRDAGLLHGVLPERATAGLTQLVECKLPKLDVAGSNPVSRSEESRFEHAELDSAAAGLRCRSHGDRRGGRECAPAGREAGLAVSS